MMSKKDMAAALKHLDWATPHPARPNCVLVDPDKAYPALLAELKVGSVDQYWLEVSYQCIKMDLQVAMKKFGFEIHIRADDGRKSRWNQSMHPKGKGAFAATKGKEARAHYKRIRGYLPS